MGHDPVNEQPLELGLFLSERVDATEGRRIDECARQAGIRLRRYTATQPPADPALIHAAFFSRELYEGSSLRRPGPASNAFFQVIDAAPNLKWLHVCSSGLDLPQYQPCLARGVTITPSSGTTAKPIAQTVTAAVLAHSRGFLHWLAAQQQRAWLPLTGSLKPRDIDDQQVVVLGAGPLGMEIGRLLSAVGFQCSVVRRRVVPTAHFGRCLSLAELDAALPQCDWLILALPLTPETEGLIDARRLALLPPHARVVNVGRGEIVDEAALVDALKHGRIAGAYLDTFIQEPLPESSPLWRLPNVWLTPHNSSASTGHEQRVIESFIKELKRWLQSDATL